MQILELKDFAEDGIFAEDEFDRKVATHDWEQYRDQAVRISSCALSQIPGWVFLQIGVELAGRARKIFFGDPHNPKKVFNRETTR